MPLFHEPVREPRYGEWFMTPSGNPELWTLIQTWFWKSGFISIAILIVTKHDNVPVSSRQAGLNLTAWVVTKKYGIEMLWNDCFRLDGNNTDKSKMRLLDNILKYI